MDYSKRGYIKLALLCCLLPGAQLAFGQIYKTVDADGNVVFTDVPPVSETAETVTLGGGSAYSPPPTAAPDAAAERPAATFPTGLTPFTATDAEDNSAPLAYQSITITYPTQDLALRDNAGNVNVRWATEPQLHSSHRLQLLMNGQPVDAAMAPNMTLTNVDRGTHLLTLKVLDEAGQALGSSETITFHLQRFSALSRARN